MNATDDVSPSPLPVHLAVIMDGNGRWAQARGLPREAGHRAGAETVREIVTECRKLGIRYLTLYTFSSENWNRPKTEVTALFSLLLEFLGQEVPRMEREGIRLNILGDIDGLPLAARTALRHGMRRTAANDGMVLNLALNYGGRAEIVRAVQELLREGVSPGPGLSHPHQRRAAPEQLPALSMRLQRILLYPRAVARFSRAAAA